MQNFDALKDKIYNNNNNNTLELSRHRVSLATYC